VALLTGGGDRPYALGLATALAEHGVRVDFIGSDFLESPELRANPMVRVLNLRGDNSPQAGFATKIVRVARYYARLVRYVWSSEPPILHVLWNDRLELVDRTLLMLYYRARGKRTVLTVHNVNVRQRDGDDSMVNRATLRIQYALADHLFVHTERMRQELAAQFSVVASKVSVIPFGINSTVPDTTLSSRDARRTLGLASDEQVILFFGNIAPYKGLEYLVDAMPEVLRDVPRARLVIAGRPKGSEGYWARVERRIEELGLGDKVLRRIEYVPDEETEVFFKAADVLVLPYTHVFQSGVLFLGYNFGLPVVATDVGSIRDDVVDGRTGFLCAPGSAKELASAVVRYFSSDLYVDLSARRPAIRGFAAERYSWAKVAEISAGVYERLASDPSAKLTGGQRCTSNDNR
jgi:glycosyltransferase involved in cell wall biosynthesis